MYKAIYRQFRPETFDRVVGQDHIVRILKNQIAQDRLSHSYLFCGTRGTGKTTAARLLAKAVNCLSDGERPCGECENCRSITEGNFPDVIEIDAASNNGVENIRDINESVYYPPFVGRRKVYIIDETHMLSGSAFNALLKTLEEPPENVMFILATTEPQKLPATILSRCLRLDFKRVSEELLTENMARICAERGVRADGRALRVIAGNADGSVRDSLSLLEQCMAAGGDEITYEDVTDMLGMAGEEKLISITDSVISGDTAGAIVELDRILSAGRDVKQFMNEWMTHFRNLLITKYVKDPSGSLDRSSENTERIRAQSEDITQSQLSYYISSLASTMAEVKQSPQPRVLLELCIVNMCGVQTDGDGNVTGRQAPERRPQGGTSGRGSRAPRVDVRGAASRAAEADDAGRARDERASGAGPGGKPGGPDDDEELRLQALLSELAQAEGTSGFQDSDDDDFEGSSSGPIVRSQARDTGSSQGAGRVAGGEGRSGRQAQSASYQDEDNEELWEYVLESGMSVQGSFALLRNGTFIREIKGNECVIAVSNDMQSRYISRETELIRDILERRTGKRFMITSIVYDKSGAVTSERRDASFGGSAGKAASPDDDGGAGYMEKRLSQWSEALGVTVEVE